MKLVRRAYDWVLSWADTPYGGLALFLYGMEQMATALKAVAGDRMRAILARLTTGRIRGMATGALVTAGSRIVSVGSDSAAKA